MHVVRIGFTPLKGGRHVEHPTVALTDSGPVGDRAFCLLDPSRNRVLRTVENPRMLQVVAGFDGETLAVRLPAGSVEGAPVPTGVHRTVDYWGRTVEVELVDGPWAASLSEHVGREVVLARPTRAGDVVYGGPVSLVTTAALARLGREVGARVDGARFRPTLVVDDTTDPVVASSWCGQELRFGTCRVRVDAEIPRCAVVDLDPASGVRDAPVLAALARYRRGEGGISFGVDAVVVQPGQVSRGDAVTLGRD